MSAADKDPRQSKEFKKVKKEMEAEFGREADFIGRGAKDLADALGAGVITTAKTGVGFDAVAVVNGVKVRIRAEVQS